MTTAFIDDASLCSYLRQEYADVYLGRSKLPQPFFASVHSVKAIVLGTDPSNPQNLDLEKVFGLENSNSPYFRSIKDNLVKVGLSIDDIYVQNLCKNYFKVVTSENSQWHKVAILWRELLKNELDGLFDKEIPVFITAWDLYLALSNSPIHVKPSFFYENEHVVPASENYLQRSIVPLFRHWHYSLARWSKYEIMVSDLFKK